MKKYLLLADAQSPHTLKWIKALTPYFDLYIISLNGISKALGETLPPSHCFVLNEHVKQHGGNYGLIVKLFKVRQIIHELQPEFINAHYLTSYGLLATLSHSSAPKAKLIHSAWGSDILVKPFQNRLFYYLTKYILQKADFVTSDAYTMSDIILNIAPSAEVSTFSFGLDSIKECTVQKEDLIFSNRTLNKNSNISQILKWFALQDKKHQLVIANDGDQKEVLQQQAQELGISERTTFVGFISAEEQEKFYQRSRYYLSIPTSDATSVSLLEAMQYGIIPIVSNIPANREWILNGINGLFFNEEIELSVMKVHKDFKEINHSILQERAIFPENIKKFVTKVNP